MLVPKKERKKQAYIQNTPILEAKEVWFADNIKRKPAYIETLWRWVNLVKQRRKYPLPAPERLLPNMNNERRPPRNFKYELAILKDRIYDGCGYGGQCEHRQYGVCTCNVCDFKRVLLRK